MKIKNFCCSGVASVRGATMAVITQKNPDIVYTILDVNTQRIQDLNSPAMNDVWQKPAFVFN